MARPTFIYFNPNSPLVDRDGRILKENQYAVTFIDQLIQGSSGLIDLATDVTGRLPFANLTAATQGSVLLGRGSSGAGDFQEITLGTGLSMAGTVLDSNAAFAQAQILSRVFVGC